MRENPDLSFELPLWGAGLLPAGLDEAGRGAWAGPVSAAAVILPADEGIAAVLSGVRDSKLMTPRQRFKWRSVICTAALAWGVGFASPQEIDALGIVPATRLAMQRALEQLEIFPQCLLVDALRLPEIPLPQKAIIHGDRLCLSIAAASVLAKTARDELMAGLDVEFPGYGFARHKGYGTKVHQLALAEMGVSEVHRRSYAPVKRRLG
jgi:ribonuclease HII